jgi:hypothetical protein
MVINVLASLATVVSLNGKSASCNIERRNLSHLLYQVLQRKGLQRNTFVHILHFAGWVHRYLRCRYMCEPGLLAYSRAAFLVPSRLIMIHRGLVSRAVFTRTLTTLSRPSLINSILRVTTCDFDELFTQRAVDTVFLFLCNAAFR